MEYRTQKILLTGNIKDEAHSFLVWCCEHSRKLYNCTLFLIRQAHFANCPRYFFFDQNDLYRNSFKLTRVKASYSKLCKDLKENPHYQAIGGSQGQQTIKSAVEAIRGYNELLPKWFNGELANKPKIPNYRKSNGLYLISYVGKNIRFDEFGNLCYLPIPNSQKDCLETPSIAIPNGIGVNKENLAELRVVPSNGKLWAEFVYKVETLTANNLDYSQGLALDHGINNLLTGVSSLGKSFIFCGKWLKFINQKYNQFVAKYKKGKSEFYWDEILAEATHKRNCRIRDAINKTARFIINYCLHHRIGNIVFGWNEEQKQESNMGKRNNQNFVQIPVARLKNRIKELATSLGIKFTETEESYTSKSSFLDNDLLPKFGEKPERFKFSGKRIKRGLYRTANGKLINADCNGSANILRKVSTQLGISLAEVCGECLTIPKRYNLSDLSQVYRKWSERVLTRVATSI